MQPALPFESHADPDPGAFAPPGEETPELRIYFVRMRRARRYVMRVRPDGDLRVTIPRGGSKADALRFAE